MTSLTTVRGVSTKHITVRQISLIWKKSRFELITDTGPEST